MTTEPGQASRQLLPLGPAGARRAARLPSPASPRGARPACAVSRASSWHPMQIATTNEPPSCATRRAPCDSVSRVAFVGSRKRRRGDGFSRGLHPSGGGGRSSCARSPYVEVERKRFAWTRFASVGSVTRFSLAGVLARLDERPDKQVQRFRRQEAGRVLGVNSRVGSHRLCRCLGG